MAPWASALLRAHKGRNRVAVFEAASGYGHGKKWRDICGRPGVSWGFFLAEPGSLWNMKEALADANRRLIHPSIEKSVLNVYRKGRYAESVKVFSPQQLLLAPPLGQKRVLAIDPNYRTGCRWLPRHRGDLILSTISRIRTK